MANSRRGSSQSEQLDVEPYQLNKDFSRSLPGSRRSSFQSIQSNTEKGKRVTSIVVAFPVRVIITPIRRLYVAQIPSSLRHRTRIKVDVEVRALPGKTRTRFSRV